MSADNYLYVRKRDDGTFGVSMRFASAYYRDEVEDAGEWPRDQAKYTRTGPVDEFGFAPVPDEWVEAPPDDVYGVYPTAEAALAAAHKAESEEWVVEYGVSVGSGVLA